MVKLARITHAGIAVCLLLMIYTTAACGKNDMDGKSRKDEAAKRAQRARRIGLHYASPYDAKKHTLATSVGASGVEKISNFSILSFDAKDQAGKSCPFDSVSIGPVKGGVKVIILSKIDPGISEKIIVKAKIILNDDEIDVTCGYRKRTHAERKALNPDQEWDFIDELEEVKVSEISTVENK